MGAIEKPIFLRPVEHITSAAFDFAVLGGAYHGSTPSIASGVYANPLALLAMFRRSIPVFTCFNLTPEGKFVLTVTDACTINWVNTTLRDALGFSGITTELTGTYTCPNVSPYVWSPSHHFADQQAFRKTQTEYFKGVQSINGTLAGVGNGDTPYKRAMTFNAELAENLGVEFAGNSEESNRCLESFFRGAVCSAPTVYDHPSTKGFWYYEDARQCEFDATAVTNGSTFSKWTTSGNIMFQSDETNRYQFCNFIPDGLSDWRTTPFFNFSRKRYNVTVEFCTAPIPEFAYYGPPS